MKRKLKARSFRPAVLLFMPKQKSETFFIALLALCKRGNHSCCSFKKSDKSDLLFCSQKTSDSQEKPKSKFPTLLFSHFTGLTNLIEELFIGTKKLQNCCLYIFTVFSPIMTNIFFKNLYSPLKTQLRTQENKYF